MAAERDDIDTLLGQILQGEDVDDDDDDYTPVTEADDNTTKEDSIHIMTEQLFIPKEQVNLRQKYSTLTHPTVLLIWSAFDILCGFLLRLGTESAATPEEIEQAFMDFDAWQSWPKA